MIRILFIVYTWASLSRAISLGPEYELMRSSSKSDEAFANVISEINQYIKDKKIDVHKLRDFTFTTPFASLNFSNGQMRDFSSIELHKSSILPQSDRVMYWTLGIGLEQFSLKYDFKSKLFKIFEHSGNLTMTVPKNNILLSGTIDVLSSKCSTTLEIVTFMNFPDVVVNVEPLSIKNFFLKQIVGFAVNHYKLLLNPAINSYLKDFILDMVPLSKINEILCKHLNKFNSD